MTLSSNNFFKKRAKSFVGINLGNYQLKGLVVKEGSFFDSFFLKKSENLVESLKKLWAEKKIPTRKVKITLKNQNCLVRYFAFPKMEKKKLSQALFYELNKFIPFNPQEVYFDFFVLKEVNPSEVLILLAVAKKDLVDKTLEIFEKANLEVSEISLDSISLINFFLNNYPESKDINACLIDIGYSFSALTLLGKGTPFLTRDMKSSVKDMLGVISRIKNMAGQELDAWIKEPKNRDEFLKLTQESFSALCQEMKGSFDYFEVNKGEHINKLYLSGGITQVQGIENIFSESLEVDSSLFDIKLENQNIFTDDKSNIINSSFAVAFGLTI